MAELLRNCPPTASISGKSVKPEFIYLRLANRHGLITGATGTGKTVTLQGLAEGFSDQGVPVFCADVKSDLSGLAEAGEAKPWVEARDKEIGYKNEFQRLPRDLLGPVRRAGTSDPVDDLRDGAAAAVASDGSERGARRRAQHRLQDRRRREYAARRSQRLCKRCSRILAARADTLTTKYGNITKASVGSDPALAAGARATGRRAFLRRARPRYQGPHAHHAGWPRLYQHPRRADADELAADSTRRSCLFLLSELFAKLPEVGDPDRPKLVFFFDEAHLLVQGCAEGAAEKVEQVVRLIRSKGVGVYFVTQNPLDVPDTVSSQLGNRVQHALRAFTPLEQKAVKAAATTFRANPAFNTEKAIMELGVGEALVSTLDDKGQPTIVQRTLIHPPNSRVGPVTDAERKAIIAESPVAGVYDKRIEREFWPPRFLRSAPRTRRPPRTPSPMYKNRGPRRRRTAEAACSAGFSALGRGGSRPARRSPGR